MTEQFIQDILCHQFFGLSEIMSPNSKVFGWEADMIRMTRAHYLYEYEIKTTVADFKAEKNKRHKHMTLTTGLNTCGRPTEIPRYFIYVVPDGLVGAKDVQVHAGLMWVRKKAGEWRDGSDTRDYELHVVKRPPVLTRDKATERQVQQILQSFAYRYWQLRLNR